MSYKRQTGAYLTEVAHPYYYALLDAGFDIDFTSPKGGASEFDQSSIQYHTEEAPCKRFLQDQIAPKYFVALIKSSTNWYFSQANSA